MVTRDELMTLTEAMEQWGHARTWWYAQVEAGRLTFYDVPGDRNTWLRRAEVEAFLGPKPRPRPDTADGTQG